MKKYLFIFITSILGITSCTNQGDPSSMDEGNEELTYISIETKAREAAPDIENLRQGEASAIINDATEFADGAKLFISQMGTSLSPNFLNEDADALPYLYIYDYEANTNANWNQEYNFQVADGRKSINWNTVKSLGSVGNSFAFYAMYFPIDNEPIFNVQTDQTGGEEDAFAQSNFIKSDIFGAYHATSSLFTRLRFRLFHLMVYLKVTIYVPVLQEKKDEKDQTIISGFNQNAMKGAYVLDVYNYFTIDWRANKSSDTEPPTTQVSGDKVKSITMYMHEPEAEDKVFTLDLSKFTSEGGGTEMVRAYNFSVLFPGGQEFKDNFLCFKLTAPDDSPKYYYFSGSQTVNSTGSLGLSQGTLQQLYLYVPRETNQAILVGAKILPWGTSSTGMTVTEQDKENTGIVK